jgi:hypothetical protein
MLTTVVGCLSSKKRPADRKFEHNKCTNLLGSKAMADDKTEATNAKKRFIDMIGYRINLDLCKVSISEKETRCEPFMSSSRSI